MDVTDSHQVPSLRSLGCNYLKDEGTNIVCEALKDSKVSKVKELVLSENNITVTGAQSVAAYLAVTGELTRCDMRHNRLRAEEKAALQSAVQGRSGFELML